MTTDERIDKLVERHEALTQSVELLTQMHIAQEKTNAEQWAQQNELSAKMMQSITRLGHIAAVTDLRLEDVEKRLGDGDFRQLL